MLKLEVSFMNIFYNPHGIGDIMYMHLWCGEKELEIEVGHLWKLLSYSSRFSIPMQACVIVQNLCAKRTTCVV